MGILSLQNISLQPIFAGKKQVGSWWNFKNIISPFYRLYYIESGEARIRMDNAWYDLRPGQLFLIPKFTYHNYECRDTMSHYYICFFDDLKQNGLLRPDKLIFQLQAEVYDLALIQRFMQLNPGIELINVDPKVYTRTIYNHDIFSQSLTRNGMESYGILMQLFSRFITKESMGQYVESAANGKFAGIMSYIHANLDRRITLTELAGRACLTTGHFSKVFKQVMGTTPCLYLQNRRIKQAQTLMLTTDMTISQIAEAVGIFNPAQFTRLFTRITGRKPKDYRAQP